MDRCPGNKALVEWPTVTDEMVEAGYQVFAGKMLMYEEDKALVRSVINAAIAACPPAQQPKVKALE